jgi:hypothetical protein
MGIQSVKLTIMQTRSAIIPLEVIFKSLHATQQYPLIKCNMDNKQENIYRIYSNGVSTDGRKIPYLTLPAVNAISREIAKKTSVSAYIEYVSAKNNKQTIYCTFEKNGNITVESTFDSVMTPEEVDALFAKRPNARISSEEITMTVCVALGATGGDGLRKTGEAIQAYLKGSGRYNSRRGPGGGWARNSAE